MAISISQLKQIKRQKESFLNELQQQRAMTESQFVGNAINVQFESSLNIDANVALEMENKDIELELEIIRVRHEIEAIDSDIKSLEMNESLQKQ